MNIIAQCFLSLLTFYKYTNLKHNDSHTGNFLYHKIKEQGYFHYNINNKDYYLKNKGYIIVIWDFGLSSNFDTSKKVYSDFKRLLTILSFIESDDIYMNEIKKIKFNNIKDMSSLKNFIIDFILKNVDTFITDKPSNIINKTPFMI